jgi:uncharacterized protein (TIRG00374 family)
MRQDEILVKHPRGAEREAIDEHISEEIVEAGGSGTRRNLLGLAISGVVLGAIVWWASSQPAPRLPNDASHLALVAVAAVLDVLVKSIVGGWRWHRVLTQSGVPHDRRDAYALVPVGCMGNTVLPARTGELLRVFLLGRRTTAPRREVLGSIVAERLLDLLVLIALFAILSWSGIGGAPGGQAPATIAVTLVALGFLGALLYVRFRRRGRFERFATTVRPFARASRLLFGRVGAKLAVVTAGIWTLYGLECYLVGASLGLSITPVEALMITVFASFSTLVPAAPGFVGTFDAAVIFAAKSLGVSGAAALSFGLLVRFIMFVPITIVGSIILMTRYGGFGTLRRLGAGKEPLAGPR